MVQGKLSLGWWGPPLGRLCRLQRNILPEKGPLPAVGSSHPTLGGAVKRTSVKLVAGLETLQVPSGSWGGGGGGGVSLFVIVLSLSPV